MMPTHGGGETIGQEPSNLMNNSAGNSQFVMMSGTRFSNQMETRSKQGFKGTTVGGVGGQKLRCSKRKEDDHTNK